MSGHCHDVTSIIQIDFEIEIMLLSKKWYKSVDDFHAKELLVSIQVKVCLVLCIPRKTL